MNPSYDFRNQVALVTGASAGMGLATARAFAQAGAAIVLADVREDRVNEAARTLIDAAHKALAITCDVSDDAQVAAMVERTASEFGRIDGAFNNAGTMAHVAPTAESTRDEWDRVIGINLRGVWSCMKYELRHMERQGSGTIVNNASVGALIGNPGIGAYIASKHGVVGLTRTAALEYIKHGVRVNTVNPGVIDTQIARDVVKGNDQAYAEMVKQVPMARVGWPEEIAAIVLWLCSPGASYVLGPGFHRRWRHDGAVNGPVTVRPPHEQARQTGPTLSRRGMLVGALGIGVVTARRSHAQQVATPVPGFGYNELTRGPAPIPPAERDLQTVVAVPWVKVSDAGIVLEGPAFARDGTLFFCDASGGRVLRLSPDRRFSTVLEMDLKPGGIAIHRDGRLFVAALDIPGGLGSISAVRPDGSDLQIVIPPQAGYLPNDLVFDASGGLYVSDFRGTSTDPAGGVYYLSPDGRTITPVLSRIAKANGVALSPDGKILWATEFGSNRLHRVELASATTATPLGTAIPYRFTGPAPDSMRADADGNVYVALYGQGRILVLNGIGIPIGQILLPGRDEGHNLLTTNMAFRPGSNDLLIVASDGDRGQGAGIFHVGAFAPALPLYAQQ